MLDLHDPSGANIQAVSGGAGESRSVSSARLERQRDELDEAIGDIAGPDLGSARITWANASSPQPPLTNLTPILRH
jgi:hypothetical protein